MAWHIIYGHRFGMFRKFSIFLVLDISLYFCAWIFLAFVGKTIFDSCYERGMKKKQSHRCNYIFTYDSICFAPYGSWCSFHTLEKPKNMKNLCCQHFESEKQSEKLFFFTKSNQLSRSLIYEHVIVFVEVIRVMYLNFSRISGNGSVKTLTFAIFYLGFCRGVHNQRLTWMYWNKSIRNEWCRYLRSNPKYCE